MLIFCRGSFCPIRNSFLQFCAIRVQYGSVYSVLFIILSYSTVRNIQWGMNATSHSPLSHWRITVFPEEERRGFGNTLMSLKQKNFSIRSRTPVESGTPEGWWRHKLSSRVKRPPMISRYRSHPVLDFQNYPFLSWLGLGILEIPNSKSYCRLCRDLVIR